MKVGDEAAVQVPGVADPVPAKVSLISPALDPGSTTVEVWLKIDNKAGNAEGRHSREGLYHRKNRRQAWKIPASAVLTAQDGSKSVMVVGTDGAAHRKPVTLGISDDGRCAGHSAAFPPRDMVITGGAYGLDEGTKVKVGPAEADDEAKPAASQRRRGLTNGHRSSSADRWSRQHRSGWRAPRAPSSSSPPILTLVGIYLAFKVPISVFPETNFPRVVIGVDNGVMPVEQMEVTITKPHRGRGQLRARPADRSLHHQPRLGRGEPVLRLEPEHGSASSSWSTPRSARCEQTLPATARITTNRLTFATFPILGYSLTSDTVPQTQLWEIATYDLKPPLNRVAGVSTVIVQGGQVPEFHVVPNLALLAVVRRHHHRPGQRHPGLQHRRLARPLRSQPPADPWPGGRAGSRRRQTAPAGGQDHGRRRARAHCRCGDGGAGHHAGLHHRHRQRQTGGAAQHRAPALQQHGRGGRRSGRGSSANCGASCRRASQSRALLRSVATGARQHLQRARRHLHRPHPGLHHSLSVSARLDLVADRRPGHSGHRRGHDPGAVAHRRRAST